MWIELAAYEIITTAASLLGLKALSSTNVNKAMKGINRPKQLPIINHFLRKQVGHISKREDWLSRKAVMIGKAILSYDDARLAGILLGRKLYEAGLQKGNRGCLGTGRPVSRGVLVG